MTPSNKLKPLLDVVERRIWEEMRMKGKWWEDRCKWRIAEKVEQTEQIKTEMMGEKEKKKKEER